MTRWMTMLLAAVLVVTSSAAMAETKQGQILDDSTSVLRQFVDIPENAIPPALLRQAYGIAVIPGVIKVGFLFGARHGKGVLAVRAPNGSWSNPSFITLTGGSFGWQAGISSTDIILVFKTQRSIQRIADGQVSLGGDASVAAGPVGRSAGASTNLAFNAEVYSYSRSRGLFAGVSVEGARLAIAHDDNWLFYNNAGADAFTILRNSNDSNMPMPGKRFVYTLDRYMPPSQNKFSYSADVNANADKPGNGQQPANGMQNAAQNGSQGQAMPYRGVKRGGITVQQASQGAGSGTAQGNNTANGASTRPKPSDGHSAAGPAGAGANGDNQNPTSRRDYGSGQQ